MNLALKETPKTGFVVTRPLSGLMIFQVSLEKVKYLILDEADRMLDMGFGPEIRKIIETFGMPGKMDRQTLMFSATFPEEIQKLAADYLNDYLFLSVGVVGGANTDVSQHIFEVDRLEKREKLVEILTDSGMSGLELGLSDRQKFGCHSGEVFV